jgi:AbrB family looped-hinge helix DNA binding protein
MEFVEVAKITTKGQITLPIQIRKRLNLKEGDKVVFLENNGKIIIDNPTKSIISEAQKAFAGLAEELGLKTEEDVIELCREVRKEMWEKNNANHD